MKKGFVLFLFIFLFFVNCAYFNTFYNAQYYFNEEEQKIKEGGKPNKETLEKVIEKSSKILQFHPETKYVDDALLLIGKSYMYLGEYTKAIRKFQELLKYYPDTEYKDQVIYYLGETYRMQKEYQLASVYYSKLLINDNDYKIESIKQLINMAIENENYKDIDSILGNLEKDEIKNNTIKFLIAKIKFKTNKLDEALKYLDKTKVSKLDKKDQFEYHRIYAEILIVKGEYEKANDIIKKGLKHFADQNMKNSLIYLQCKILEKDKRYDKALNLAEDVLAQGKGVALRDSFIFFEGEIYEQYYEDYDKALEKFTIIKNEIRNSQLIPETEVKIMSLNLLKKIQEDTTSTKEDLIKNRFLLAEINYLNMKRIDKAIEYYSIIIDSFPESFYAPKSLYALAYIFYNDKNDKDTAISYLNKIIEKYPSSEFAYYAKNYIEEINNDSENKE